MTVRGGLWVMLVFTLTLLIELPASWVPGLPASGVAGSVWRGHAAQWGPVGPVEWAWRPWRLAAQVDAAFQGQNWQVRIQGWPWQWRAEVQALGVNARVPADYRLAGQWQGMLRMQGSGRVCRSAQGRLMVADLALVEPWSFALGQGGVEVDCHNGWRLLGTLVAPGQHDIAVTADLLERRAQMELHVQPEAALAPLLRGVQWLGPQATRAQRWVTW